MSFIVMAGNVSGSSNRSQSQSSSNSSVSKNKTNSSTKTHGGHASEGHSARIRHRSPHGGHHHHHAHSPHMEDIQKAELAARQEEQSKIGNGEREYSCRKKDDHHGFIINY